MNLWRKLYIKYNIIDNIGNIELSSYWKLYHHYSNDDKWHLESYTNVYNIYTIKDFWYFYNNKMMLNNNMFFLMRNDIKPIYECDENKNGGYWSFKIDNNDIYKVWTQLSLYLVSDKLSKNKDNIINGITLSTKKNAKKKFYIVKIWNCDKEYKSIDNINHSIINNRSKNIMYNSFF